ncbi:hypothetical protein D9M69_652600 [compost metagenome]
MACFALDRLAIAGVFVERLAVLLQGAVHGRHLLNRAGETVQHLDHLTHAAGHGPGLDHLALGVAGAGLHAQPHGGLVGLVGIQVELAELGGGTETQRQHTGGERVQRAGVAGFFSAQQPFGLLQCLVAGKTQRFVEQQHPMHRAPLHPGA